MTKPKPKPRNAPDAVRAGLEREAARRPDGLKPVEIVKAAICAYQAYAHGKEEPGSGNQAPVESADRAGLRRGTQASVDRLLFNANYWLAAYEERIVAACALETAPRAPRASVQDAGSAGWEGASETQLDGEAGIDPLPLLKAVAVWGTHTLKLNTLGSQDVTATFERFCPPFATNNRKGSVDGPVVRFEREARLVAESHPACGTALLDIATDMRKEADAYDALAAHTPLDALFALLPAWCLQDRIPLVTGNWWNDADVMTLIADKLYERFLEMGHGEVPCRYFHDSMLEVIDAYLREVSASTSPLSRLAMPELISLVHNAREAHPDFEIEGYGDALPGWLAPKEQLVWNTLACALYGPSIARPLLAATPGQLVDASAPRASGTDVITDLAVRSFARYSADRANSNIELEYESFADQPDDLRKSSIEHIRSIPRKLEILGMEIIPDGSCYPEQKITSLTPSEVECLAILEHRRWLEEREAAGWKLGPVRDAEAKTSPYLVAWEDLPDRAREWNRSAIRNIPHLLAQEHLAIVKSNANANVPKA